MKVCNAIKQTVYDPTDIARTTIKKLIFIMNMMDSYKVVNLKDKRMTQMILQEQQ